MRIRDMLAQIPTTGRTEPPSNFGSPATDRTEPALSANNNNEQSADDDTGPPPLSEPAVTLARRFDRIKAIHDDLADIDRARQATLADLETAERAYLEACQAVAVRQDTLDKLRSERVD